MPETGTLLVPADHTLSVQDTRSTTNRALLVMFIVVAMALCLVRPATAGSLLDVPIVGGRLLVANTGYVTATFLGSDAGYFNTLFFDGDAADVRLFDKHSDVGGTPLNLGWFTAGTELVFRLDVRNTGNRFFTGDAARNIDGIAHALAVTTLEQQTYVTTVGFEDLLGGGDLDYNDFTFVLRNVIDPPPIPSPSALALLGLGIGLLGWSLHRRNLQR